MSFGPYQLRVINLIPISMLTRTAEVSQESEYVLIKLRQTSDRLRSESGVDTLLRAENLPLEATFYKIKLKNILFLILIFHYFFRPKTFGNICKPNEVFEDSNKSNLRNCFFNDDRIVRGYAEHSDVIRRLDTVL